MTKTIRIGADLFSGKVVAVNSGIWVAGKGSDKLALKNTQRDFFSLANPFKRIT